MACISDPRFTDHLSFKTGFFFAAPRGDLKKQFLLFWGITLGIIGVLIKKGIIPEL